jgi:hypothetical protein
MGPDYSCGRDRGGVLGRHRASRPDEEASMGKGQKSNKEARKPKKEGPKKQNASNPSQKEGVVRGLDNMKNG